MDGSFLQRWSRLKRDADAALPEPLAEPEADALGEEEIAALPDIGTLTAESDITGFLRKSVPPALRNAALRRMWLLDPAIRDFVGPARDYSYDWNTPGGVPGNGPLEPGAATAMLRRIFGDERKTETAPETPTIETETATADVAAEDVGDLADPDAQERPAPAMRRQREGSGSCA